MKAAVIGSGSWGTALGLLLARNGHHVWLSGRDIEEVSSIQSCRENLRYLPGFILPETVTALPFQDLVGPFDFTVIAVPTNAIRGALTQIGADSQIDQTPILLASKGLESTSGKMPTDIVLDTYPNVPVGAISGPNLALEVARAIPTAAVVAFNDLLIADKVRSAFNCSSFRAYRTTDLIGVELAGALKNILAIGAGLSDGMGFGDNTKGALMARGLREMLMIGEALGAKHETFLGIAGVGDLFATSNSKLSRNYRLGEMLSKGHSVEEALQLIGQVVEGVSTSEAVGAIVRPLKIDAPIFEGIGLVLDGRLDPRSGVRLLMERVTPDERISIRQ